MAFQFRRGTDAERQSITPKPGEPLYVTDTGQVYVGDGTTQGGNLVSISVSDDDSPSLGGNLDLNGNDIVGTGNINIDGFINATGNINLGDGAEDNVIVGGVIESNLVPGFDGVYDIGSVLASWRGGFFEGLTINGSAVAESIQITTIYGNDSTVLYDGNTDTITAETLEGDVIGSIFGVDSTLLVDANNATVNANEFNTSILQISNEIISSTTIDPIRFETESGIRFNNENIDGQLDSNLIVQNSARTVGGSIVSISDNDNLGGVAVAGYNGTEFVAKSLISTSVLASSGLDHPSKLEIYVEDNNAVFSPALSINPDRSVSADIFTTGTYANDSDRDSRIIDPSTGMIIFNIRDDSTGTPVFQGFDGTNWVDLN